MKIKLKSIHRINNPKRAVKKAQAIFIGGGNTFRLLNEMYRTRIMDEIKEKVKKGMPYIGTSAGVNVACPTIKTTNDMPTVYPPSFDALNLIPFQINPHYVDPDPKSKHMGETRDARIKEFQEESNFPVVGLREGSWIRIEKGEINLKGDNGARIFIKGQTPFNCNSGEKLNF